ncbi:hypothetical protein ROZALSC1DRAFT_23023, partial [Rozella allomycis CSF55]
MAGDIHFNLNWAEYGAYDSKRLFRLTNFCLLPNVTYIFFNSPFDEIIGLYRVFTLKSNSQNYKSSSPVTEEEVPFVVQDSLVEELQSSAVYQDTFESETNKENTEDDISNTKSNILDDQILDEQVKDLSNRVESSMKIIDQSLINESPILKPIEINSTKGSPSKTFISNPFLEESPEPKTEYKELPSIKSSKGSRNSSPRRFDRSMVKPNIHTLERELEEQENLIKGFQKENEKLVLKMKEIETERKEWLKQREVEQRELLIQKTQLNQQMVNEKNALNLKLIEKENEFKAKLDVMLKEREAEMSAKSKVILEEKLKELKGKEEILKERENNLKAKEMVIERKEKDLILNELNMKVKAKELENIEEREKILQEKEKR